jgi:CHU_C Type IX secretion signal domain/Beta-propeller repeat
MCYKKHAYFLILLVTTVMPSLYGQHSPRPSGWGFIENNGQITDQTGQTQPTVRYLLPVSAQLGVQLRSSGFSYDTYTAVCSGDLINGYPNTKGGAVPTTTRINTHRVDIEFVDVSPAMRIRTAVEGQDALYYVKTGITYRAAHYQRVVYESVWPGIDMEFVSNPHTSKPFEYNFIVHPGADPARIRMRYSGMDAIASTDDGSLVLSLQSGNLTERIPQAWQMDNLAPVSARYQIIMRDQKEVVVGISTSKNNTSGMVIDPIPVVSWSTYLGGADNDFARGMTLDAQANVYVAASSQSITQVATSGTYQNTLAGNYDAVVAKYNTSGQRQWATYFGGPDAEFAQAVAVDSSGMIYVTGATRSASGIASAGAHQIAYAADFDGFLLKLDPNGQRLWSTYYGGSGFEFSNHVAIKDNLVAITGWTESTNGMAAAGAHDVALNGLADAFVAVFNPAGTRLWGTYFGADDVERGLQVAFAPNSNVIVSGWSSSPTGVATTGAYQTTYGGSTADVFLSRFSQTGSLIWATYLGGAGEEYADALTVAPDGTIYTGGQATSVSGIATTGTFQTTQSGDIDGFVARFDASGQRIWGTYFGGAGTDAAYGLTYDAQGFVYACGFTNSATGIATTGTHQPATGGDYDAFIIKFDANGQREWGTYFGGTNEERAYHVGVDQDRNIYTAGLTQSASGVATAGAAQAVYAGNTDIFVVKFAPCGPLTMNIPNGGYLCNNAPFVLELQGSEPGTYTVSYSVDGVPQPPFVTNGGATFFWNYTGAWADSVQITAVELEGCPVTLTGLPFVKLIYPVQVSAPTYTCSADQQTYTVSATLSGGFMNAYVNLPISSGFMVGNVFTSTPIPSGQVYDFGFYSGVFCDTAMLAGSHTCLCATPPTPTIQSSNQTVCSGSDVVLTASGGATYTWSGGILNGIPFAPTASQTYTVTASDAAGCTATASTTVSVSTPFAVTIQNPNQTVCSGSNAVLTASGGASYTWTSGIQNGIPFVPAASQAYTVTATDAAGCTATASTIVSVSTLTVTIQNPNQTVCSGSNAVLTASGGATYTWSGGIQNGIPFVPTAAQTYTVTATDVAGCTATASTTVSVSAPFAVTIQNPNPTVCSGSDVVLTASGGATYTWSGGILNGIPFAPTASQTYTVTASDAVGCTATASTSITLENPPVISIININGSVCSGASVVISASGGVSYQWSHGAQNGTYFTATTTQAYTVTVTNAAGCSATATTSIIVIPPIDIQVDVSPNPIVCPGQSVTLTASGGTNYVWLGIPTGVGANFNVQNGVAFVPSGSAQYIVTVSDGSVCTATATVLVEVATLPDVQIEGPATICAGQTAQLAAIGNGSALWNTGETTTTIEVAPLTNTDYEVILTDANNCQNTATWTIAVDPVPVVTAISGANTPDGTLLMAAGANQYLWTPAGGLSCTNCADPIANPAQQTTYCVTGTADNGCTQSACVDVRPANQCPYYIPNALLVGSSDHGRFCVESGGCVDSFRMKVYDRWGNLIWESGQDLGCWDGTTATTNQVAEPGVYVYWAEIRYGNGLTKIEKGDINVIR